MALSGEQFDRIDRDTTTSRLCFKPAKRFVKVECLRIEPWSGVPTLDRVVKAIDIRVCRRHRLGYKRLILL